MDPIYRTVVVRYELGRTLVDAASYT
jgi:hypothetical protein